VPRVDISFQYVAMRSQLGADARAARNDPYLQEALYGHQQALDNAFERTLNASGNTADIGALRRLGANTAI
jgi:hypothetical protein